MFLSNAVYVGGKELSDEIKEIIVSFVRAG